MKRAFIDFSHEALADLLRLKPGIRIQHIEARFHQGAVVRLYLDGDGLPEDVDVCEGQPAYNISGENVGKILRDIPTLPSLAAMPPTAEQEEEYMRVFIQNSPESSEASREFALKNFRVAGTRYVKT